MRGGGFKKFYEAYYKELEGRKIIRTGIDAHGFPFFVAAATTGPLRDELLITVSQDEERNGPGHLFGLPRPEGF